MIKIPENVIDIDFNKLVQEYYISLRVDPNQLHDVQFTSPHYVNRNTDPLGALKRVLLTYPATKPKILTVLGYDAPGLFLNLLPESTISTYDISPNQLDLYWEKYNRHNISMYICDILIPNELTKILSLINPDLLFISNIFDFAKLGEGMAFKEIIGKFMPDVLLTTLHILREEPPLWDQHNLNLGSLGFNHNCVCNKYGTSSAHLFSKVEFAL